MPFLPLFIVIGIFLAISKILQPDQYQRQQQYQRQRHLRSTYEDYDQQALLNQALIDYIARESRNKTNHAARGNMTRSKFRNHSTRDKQLG